MGCRSLLTLVHAFRCWEMAFTKRKTLDKAVMARQKKAEKKECKREKGAIVQKASDTASSARGDGGPNVYDMSKSLRARHDLRFRLAWQG